MMHKKILIVEDDPGIRETVKDILIMAGFNVATAENGLVALKLLQEPETPCLILLDLMMPVMDGWQFLEALKNDPQNPHAAVPIVVISALGDLDMVQKQYNCGILKKPVTIQQLVTLAKQYCVVC